MSQWFGFFLGGSSFFWGLKYVEIMFNVYTVFIMNIYIYICVCVCLILTFDLEE